jgi:hypothetical protein
MEFDLIKSELGEVQFFIRKSLPTLIHLQISEALQSVIGTADKFSNLLLDFEVRKLKDLEVFENNHNSVNKKMN